MLLNKAQREAIDNLAAMFFEKSDDLIAVSSQLESVIERRYNIVIQMKSERISETEFNDRVRRKHL
jgi:hypothetical protein